MKHREKIETLIEMEIKKRKVMKMSRFIVENEKRRFCEEVVKYYDEKKQKVDRFFEDENLIFQNAKRSSDYLVVVATNKQTRETFFFKQFKRKEYFENEKSILHIFKQDEQNPFLDLVQTDNSRMLLKKKGERYSLLDFSNSVRHQWQERELVFIFEYLLKVATSLKKEGIYLGDYTLDNISLIETARDSGRYVLKILNADKAVQKKGTIGFSSSDKFYSHPLLREKNIHLNSSEMEACDIWSIMRCICLLMSELDYTLSPSNDYQSMYEFFEQTVQNHFPFLYKQLLVAFYVSDSLVSKSISVNLSSILANSSQVTKNLVSFMQHKDDVKLKQNTFDGLLDYMERSYQSQQGGNTLRWKKVKDLENNILSQQRPLSRFSEQMDLYQFLMKANLFEKAVDTIERVISESNSVHEREVLLLNLDYIYCLFKIGMKYKGELRLNELEKSFMRYAQYDFEILYKYSLASISYEKSNISDLFNFFPEIIALSPAQAISRHYLFYLLQCQLVQKYLETGKAELGLMYNQIAIDYAYDNIIKNSNSNTLSQKELLTLGNDRMVTFDNYNEKDDMMDEFISSQNNNKNTKNNIENKDFTETIQNKLKSLNLGVCEDNKDLIGQYLFLMEEYELAIKRITDLQTRAACFFYLEKYDEAITIYEGLKDMIHFQSDPSIYLSLVMCYYFQEDYQKAYQHCMIALTICDKEERAKLYNEQSATQFSKTEEQAYRDYKSKLNERSTNSNSTKNLKKEKHYERIYQQYNFKASALVLKAFCEVELGRIDTALENMKYSIDHFNRVGLLYEKLDMLENITFAYMQQSFTFPQSAKKAQEVALDGYNQKLILMQQTGRTSIEIDFSDSLNIISLSYLNVTDFKNAIKYAESSLESILDNGEQNNFRYTEASTKQNIGQNYQIENTGYFSLLWKQYLYVGLLYDNLNNKEKVIVCGQKALEILKQCAQTVQNTEEEINIYLILAIARKNMRQFEDSLRYFVKAIEAVESLSRIDPNTLDKSKIVRIQHLHIQVFSSTLSVYSSEEYDSNPSDGHWCAEKMETLLHQLKPLKHQILPKYYLQLSQYLDLINDTPRAIELAKTAAILHDDIFKSKSRDLQQNEIKTKIIIYNTLITMLQQSKRNKEAESYLAELQKFS